MGKKSLNSIKIFNKSAYSFFKHMETVTVQGLRFKNILRQIFIGKIGKFVTQDDKKINSFITWINKKFRKASL